MNGGAGGKKRVEIVGPTKSADLAQLADVDLVVIPGSNDVRQRLEQSAAVAAYALLPSGVRRVPEIVGGSKLKAPLCTLRTESGFAVQTSEGSAQLVAEELDADAQIFNLGNDRTDDLEIFADVEATAAQVDAIENVLKRDPAVKSYRFLTHEDAFAEFERDFADQPELVSGASPDNLPESFRVTMIDRGQVETATERYGKLAGVDVVINATSRVLAAAFMLPPVRESGIGEIFLPVEASAADRDRLSAAIAADTRLTNVRFLSHDDAYNEFKRDFADQPDLVASTSPEILPESFRVTLVNPDDATSVESDYSADPIVDAAVFSDSKKDAALLDDYCD